MDNCCTGVKVNLPPPPPPPPCKITPRGEGGYYLEYIPHHENPPPPPPPPAPTVEKYNFVKSGLLYPPEASGGYFGLAFATPPPRVERFSALTL